MLWYEWLLPTPEFGMLGTRSHDLGWPSKEMFKTPNILWHLPLNECIRLDPFMTDHTQTTARQKSQTMLKPMMWLHPLWQSPTTWWNTVDSMLHQHLWWTLQWKGSSTILAKTTSRNNSNLPMQWSNMCMQWIPMTFKPHTHALVKIFWTQLPYPQGRGQTIWAINKVLLTTKLETTAHSNRTWIPLEPWSKNT